jgi:hypothetical protein
MTELKADVERGFRMKLSSMRKTLNGVRGGGGQ